ncbi:C40 family peptidase [Streptomyces chumphonensis]|uniref:C40 family peptidase n=1 Tax=Streptomyces chumphonensis TaxID=1214925 RepID=A0A927EZ99_9ACTN|nr:C40 family peptidase [Streptomyces chumphonensis]MBD3932366.1 C40 family peptidase [Streptomyces chumphonensis]
MAAHRKHRSPRTRDRSRPRTWASLALAGAATATAAASAGGAVAAPRPDARQVRTEVDQLHREAEAAAELHHAAKERSRTAARQLDSLRDGSARATRRVNAARNALGAHATAQYRSGVAEPAARLALSTTPEEFLRRASTRERVGLRQHRTLRNLRGLLRESTQLREEGTRKAGAVRAAEREARRHKEAARTKLAEARSLLRRLTPPDRTDATDRADDGGRPGEGGSEEGPATPGTGTAPAPRPAPAPGGRAAQALAFARNAIGTPYGWGATGPDAYDCSGLTQAAWRAAGVYLPRTTYTQVDAGRRVSRAELAPGDLVFFYQGLSHVGLYIGGGQMIHAPRTGSTVRVDRIDTMPFAAATRPA